MLTGSIFADGIDLRQAFPRLDHTPLLGPYPAAQRDVDSDAAILVQQLIRALQRVLGSFHALSRLSQFQVQEINHFSALVAVPSIVNRRRSHLFRFHPSIHQTVAAHSKNTSAAHAINIPVRVCHLGGSAGTSLNCRACSVAIFSKDAAVSRGVQPCASEAVTSAANAASMATSQLASRSGLPFGNRGGSTALDMHTKRLAHERFLRPCSKRTSPVQRTPRFCQKPESAALIGQTLTLGHGEQGTQS